ncbi:hypothetical protein OG413_34390 [Streptomyces sp. NBC_01433]|uniref:hypothetical protein n=1 Tax=Streptomyces sp. NBC_01433 TaxID=2903864 RepID=UPI00224C9156|nr:hypothetical protein [Streptomyces sp. NBC_01433]MCX4680307.1 hypothetical protein [Streptomyces sp. NBC_01433]
MTAPLSTRPPRSFSRPGPSVAGFLGLARPPPGFHLLDAKGDVPRWAAARAPYRIAEEEVNAWRVPPFTGHRLVHLIAFGTIRAVERVEAGLLSVPGQV